MERLEQEVLVVHLTKLLTQENAHVTLVNAIENIPFNLLGRKPNGLPYSIWQLAEHIRIAQNDILEFSRNAEYQSPAWPEGYWPAEATPSSEDAWKKCGDQIKKDQESFVKLLEKGAEHLFEPFPYGDGQTLFREALVLADHNSYHTGEIIILRRMLHDWGK